MNKCCETCVWVHRFEPRADEIARWLVIGCKKPGYEGYSSREQMACGGVFYSPDSHLEIARSIQKAMQVNQEERQKLHRLIEARTADDRRLMSMCPHPKRSPYMACGVETSQCDFCGHEIHVRDY